MRFARTNSLVALNKVYNAQFSKEIETERNREWEAESEWKGERGECDSCLFEGTGRV